MVDAERLGGLAARKLPAGTRRLVLVPWDYGADCQPTPWSRSARWVEPGGRGFFTGVLRDREHWAGGMPAFDVFPPAIAPYPARGGLEIRGTRPHPDSMLTAEQYFELSNLLPTFESIRRLQAEALVPLLDWARANPELARRSSARSIISSNRYAAEGVRIRRIIPPIIGTYRFEAILTDSAGRPSSPQRTFYVRTRPHVEALFDPLRRRSTSPASDSLATKNVDPGYAIYAAGATSIDSLPVDLSRRLIKGWLSMIAEPEASEGGGELWRGVVGVDLVAGLFPADSALKQFAQMAQEESFQRYQADIPYRTDACFIRSPEGKIMVTQAYTLSDGRTLTLNGERISEQVVAEPAWMWP